MTENTHVKEDHVVEQHVIWNFNTKDHIDGWHVTENITAEDHGDRHHVTNITVTQQYFGDSKPIEECNIDDRQDYGMISIEELLND